MKIWKMAKYCEDSVFKDTDDAEFLAGKLKVGDQLDFTDVTDISIEALKILLTEFSLEDLDGLVTPGSDNETVAQKLLAWVDSFDAGEHKPKKPTFKTPASRNPAPIAPTPRFHTVDQQKHNRYTPSRLHSRLKNQLRSYIESAYPLSDPILVRARNYLLEEEHDKKLLAQEPYIETTQRYKTASEGYRDLGLPNKIGDLLHRIANDYSPSLLYPGMWWHQARAFTSYIRDGKNTIVATGTGSGKTECFLVPLLAHLHSEADQRPQSFKKPGVRALILYPMNALVNDQTSRLRLFLGNEQLAGEFCSLHDGGRNPTFGMYTGRTPYPGPRKTGRDAERVKPLMEFYSGKMAGVSDEVLAKLKSKGRFPAKDIEGFYADNLVEKYVDRSGKDRHRWHWKKRLHTQPGDRELLTRQEMIHGTGSEPGHSPDVLVTNYSMLEYMLMRPFERPLFEETRQWLAADKDNEFLIVLDEAHMYRGSKGAEVAFLIRRLKARLGLVGMENKLRVICTSASLGDDDEAKKFIKYFAADLSGTDPANFEAITGEKELPTPAVAGDRETLNVLSKIDLKTIDAVSTPDKLLSSLNPLFSLFEYPVLDPKNFDENAIFSALYDALNGNPIINQLLTVTGDGAISLADLATGLFKENTEASRKAAEVLVTLGTLARPKPDEPGLVPTRVHMMFRGLNGLYACINPCCSQRQDSPGERALLGKLFTSPRQTCNGCGGRVLEIASCRGCGAPYLKAWLPKGTIESLSFLWSEVEGDVEDVYLLLTKPRHNEFCEEVRVHITTGYIDLENSYPDEQVVTMWLALKTDSRNQAVRVTRFEKCPMCKPPSARSRSIISDFETRGEQAFTALIDTQFAEQPPQTNDETLPNKGRKVLVFSDGRQKAARLAPALEYSHSRDLFRQLLALSVREIETIGATHTLKAAYAAIVWLSYRRRVDPFPLADVNELTAFNAHRELASQGSLAGVIEKANQGLIGPTLNYSKALFTEITDKFFSLQALGLATICEHPLLSQQLLSTFPDDDFSYDEAVSIFRSWMRVMLEARHFLPPGSDVINIGDFGNRPDGIELVNDKNIVPQAFDEFLATIAKTPASADSIRQWFIDFVGNSQGFLDFTNNRYFLSADRVGITLGFNEDGYQQAVFRCTDCGALHLHAVRETCHQCAGKIVAAEEDYLNSRTGFYRDAVHRALNGNSLEPFGLITAEHSAQLTGDGTDAAPFNKTELYELRFQDMKVDQGLPIDILSCTTTMEVGIDIGALSGVALRNVPPHVSNYQQRAGRAGRRGKAVASVLTYAHGSSHDSQMYNAPAEIISGDVLSPIVYVENVHILHRHINAYLIQRFFHEKVVAAPDLYELFQSLGTVEDFLSEKYSCSYSNLLNWLDANADILKDEIREWSPKYSHGAQQSIDRESVIEDCIGSLKNELSAILPVDDYAGREHLEGLALDHLTRKIEENLLETLINQAVLPRYAFPTDLVNFWVPKERKSGDHAHRLEYDYQPSRDLKIALSEYAPGRNITIDKLRFTAAALYSPYQESMATIISKADSYTACECGYVSMLDKSLSYTLCPCCGGSELFKKIVIRPPGFAPDINEKRRKDQGDGVGFGGQVTKAQIEISEPPSAWDEVLFCGRLAVYADSKELVLVNKGKDDNGFIACQTCGRTEYIPAAGIGFTRMLKRGEPRAHKHPIEKGLMCNGQISKEFFMGYKFITDVLLLKIKLSDPVICPTGSSDVFSVQAGRSALTSLVETLCIAASRVLQIDEGELSGSWTPIPGGGDQEVYLFLYDLLPGGAGYTRLVKNNLEKVLSMAQEILSGCDCEQSCYNCLRHYGNNYIHAQLDRTLALDILTYLRTGKSPSVNTQTQAEAVKQISEVLELKGFEREEEGNMPLLITKGERKISLTTHHPLTRPDKGGASLCIDTYTLVHDTPTAMARIESLF